MQVRWLERTLSLDGTLDKNGRHNRVVFLMTHVFVLIMDVILAPSLFDGRGRYVFTAAVVLSTVTALFAILTVLCSRPLTTGAIVGVAFCDWLAIVSADYTARAAGNAVWVLMVLVVDFLLVMQVTTRYSMIVVCTTVVYLVVMAAEERLRFGLLDMPGLMTQEERWSRMTKMSTCVALPCPIDPTNYLAASLVVFVVDFIATRGFAAAVRAEQASMERTIATVQEIASLLAGYDVEQVAELLQAHEKELPEGMAAALRKLEQNLRMYKAYLPKTCLPFDGEVVPRVSVVSSSTLSSFSSTVKDTAVTAPIVCVQPLVLSSTKATLLTLNIKDTLHRLEEDSARFSDLFTTVLLKTLQATDSRRGMVDVFVGDRIHCSFNTSKQCASHATSALHAASMLMRAGLAASVSVGVATGKVLRGDMGCDVMRRFSMVGTLVRDVHGMERAGRMLGCDVLCNRLCFSEAECEHDLRLLPCKVEVASCGLGVVAELVAEEYTEDVMDEWMYQIGGKKHWEDYNTVVRGYMHGECRDTDVAKAWVEAGGSGTPAHAVPSGTCGTVRC